MEKKKTEQKEKEMEEKEKEMKEKENEQLRAKLAYVNIANNLKATLNLAMAGTEEPQEMVPRMAANIKEANDFVLSHLINQPEESMTTYIRSTNVIDNLKEVLRLYGEHLVAIIAE
ncbi:uncharacterized protein LOC131886575 [Tigriopus californicus]|uniref:uncharacterized protein LOC131886575 n=1 Tax=Tigriopus californicus TaxID=6832 RepID=UPI0027DA6F4E|nr:uncharacterized protein LOC131886575 [Tigriopus californicus]